MPARRLDAAIGVKYYLYFVGSSGNVLPSSLPGNVVPVAVPPAVGSPGKIDNEFVLAQAPSLWLMRCHAVLTGVRVVALWRIRQVADYLSVSQSTVFDWGRTKRAGSRSRSGSASARSAGSTRASRGPSPSPWPSPHRSVERSILRPRGRAAREAGPMAAGASQPVTGVPGQWVGVTPDTGAASGAAA